MAESATGPTGGDGQLKQCDLVMKGGITSGVVYPAAVMLLKDHYRFRSIGGTSAGAIAAALTAAAEFDRERGGFDRLQAVRDELKQPDFLRRIFRAAGPTAPLLNLLVDLTARTSARAKALAATWLLPWHFRIVATLTALAGAGAGLLAAWLLSHLFGPPRPAPAAGWTFALVGAVVGLYAGPLVVILRTLFVLLPRQNCFGLCSGLIPRDPDVLANWLHRRIQRLAGRADSAPPLTFADLAGKQPDPAGVERSIQLRMMTSNLSQGQPYVFPRPAYAGKDFIFCKAEFDQLFPPDVVAYLVGYRASHDDSQAPSRVTLADGYHFLPPGDDLPVLVATRMSLSFPVLLSAIPLYTIKPNAFHDLRDGRIPAIGPDQLQRNWFSDGGISSNFPIHFFDSFLPTRPTFGMNLNYVDPAFKAKDSTQIHPDAFSATVASLNGAANPPHFDDVQLPSLHHAAHPHWKPIGDLVRFLGAIFVTAKDYHDNTQMMLPSYRERTVQIWLRPDEGGLNLAMLADTIKKIDEKGNQAGQCLLGMDFRQHQWVRLRVLMAALEPQLRKMAHAFPGLADYQRLLDDQLIADLHWYRQASPSWCSTAATRLDALTDFFDRWRDLDPKFCNPEVDANPAFWAHDPPKPIAVLRVTPET